MALNLISVNSAFPQQTTLSDQCISVWFFTYNGSVSTLQVGLMVNVYNGRQEILRTDKRERSVGCVCCAASGKSNNRNNKHDGERLYYTLPRGARTLLKWSNDEIKG